MRAARDFLWVRTFTSSPRLDCVQNVVLNSCYIIFATFPRGNSYRPVAIVVAGSARPWPQELNNFLVKKFAKWQLPASYVFVSELPHTSTGKLLKSALRDRNRNHLNEGPVTDGN
jgi:acyl-coenzyme A synthetase/AMP-(fatty) acid ligase